MGRVQVRGAIPEFEIELPDGQVLTFRLDMEAFAYLQDEHEDEFGYLTELMDRAKGHNLAAITDILYIGVRASCPEMTLKEFRRKLPLNPSWMMELGNVLGGALTDTFEGIPERPTMPPTPEIEE